MKKITINTNTMLGALSIAGIALSSYLWWSSQNGNVGACLSGGCGVVLTNPAAYILGIPIAAWGVLFYTAFLFLVFERHFIQHTLLNKLVMIFAVAGFIFTLYLRYLEFVVIKNWCSWCEVSALFTLIMLIIAIVEYKKGLWKQHA